MREDVDHSGRMVSRMVAGGGFPLSADSWRNAVGILRIATIADVRSCVWA